MTRINTNVSSLTAQHALANSQGQLQQALTRLSTGLRINVGKDDPAGLIASELLRSDIVSVGKAITNSQRANQLVATADSALGQVSGLLNDIRGLISEAANNGALSEDQISANQLQIDSSLEAINRIAQTTSFQGRRLLDGNLDFVTTGVDSSKVNNLQIQQANFGSFSQIGVSVQVTHQATQGKLTYQLGALASNAVLQIGGKQGTESFTFDAGSSISEIANAVNLVSDATGVQATVQQEDTKGAITVSSLGSSNDIVVTANTAGFDPGNVRVKFSTGTTSATAATYTPASGSDPATIDVALQVSAYQKASATVNPSGANNQFTITADTAGADANGIKVVITDGGNIGQGNETAAYDSATRILTVTIDDDATTADDIVTAINDATNNPQVAGLFTAALTSDSDGSGVVDPSGGDIVSFLANGVDGGNIVATANDVIGAINTAAGSLVTASLATGNDGYGTVTPFQEYAFYGSQVNNNYLQFLGPDNSRNIKFVAAAPNQTLSVDTTTDPQVLNNSSATIQDVANASVKFTATAADKAYDGYAISYVNNANLTGGGDEYAILDRDAKTLKIYIKSTVTDADDVIAAVNNDDIAGRVFTASNFGSSTGAGKVTAAATATTSGALYAKGTLIVNLATDSSGVVQTTANDLINFFNNSANSSTLDPLGISVSNADGSDGTGKLAHTASAFAFATSGTDLADAQAVGETFAVNGINASVKVTAVTPGAAYDGVQIKFIDDGVLVGNTAAASYDADTKILTVNINAGTTTATTVVSQIDSDLGTIFDASNGRSGNGSGLVTITDTGTTSGGVVDNGSADGAALLGNVDQADVGLTFTSADYGSDAFVQINALSGSFALVNSNNVATTRSTGTDVDARINGVKAVGKGLSASINTSALDLSLNLSSALVDGASTSFAITGGGALFQLGPDVVSNQQARLGIQAVSTSTLGGVSGKLFELASGGAKSLANDVKGAAAVIDEVISQVTALRGRLGAFQKTTLDTNINTLNVTLENLTDAQSSIRDADFAAESAALTRAQILVQSGTAVLQIANSTPQNVLSLLRG